MSADARTLSADARPRKLAQATDAAHLEANPSPGGPGHSARPRQRLGFILRIVALRKTRKRPQGPTRNFTTAPHVTVATHCQSAHLSLNRAWERKRAGNFSCLFVWREGALSCPGGARRGEAAWRRLIAGAVRQAMRTIDAAGLLKQSALRQHGFRGRASAPYIIDENMR